MSGETGLFLYRDAGSATYVAYIPREHTGSTYIETTHDCEPGEVQESKLFLRNDEEGYYFTDIKVGTSTLSSFEDTLGIKTGWGAKLYAGDTQPTEAQWDEIDYGNVISLSNLGSALASDTTTYLPLWLRIECPAGIQPTIKENIAVNVEYTRTAV